jgi:hypothetical protein
MGIIIVVVVVVVIVVITITTMEQVIICGIQSQQMMSYRKFADCRNILYLFR